jgi:hypothetical protein
MPKAKEKKTVVQRVKADLKENWPMYLLSGVTFILGAVAGSATSSPSQQDRRQSDVGDKFMKNWK